MHDFLKKAKARPGSFLDGSPLFSGKDPIEPNQAKEPQKEFVKQTDTDFTPRQAGRDWWWCDDV